MLRKKIARLPETMKNEFKGNVRDFNAYVAEQRNQLLGRGQEVNELITHLFDTYLYGVVDEEYHRYIESYQNLYDDGVVITPEKLMQNALTKYDTIMQRKEASGDTDNRILALKAESTICNEVAELKAKIANMEANYAASNKGNNNKSNQNNAANKVPAWKKVAPTENESKTMVKTVNDKKITFHWCPHHQMWTIHLPKDCTYKKEGTSNEGASNQTPERKGEDQKLVLNKALLDFLIQDSDE
jgi:hypothetical protein